MRRNDFTQVPIQKQASKKASGDLDIEFLDYDEVDTLTRPINVRQTPRNTQQRTGQARTQRQGQQRTGTSRSASARPANTRPSTARPASGQRTDGQRMAKQGESRQSTSRQGATRQGTPRTGTARPASTRSTEARQGQQRTGTSRQAQQRPAQERPATARQSTSRQTAARQKATGQSTARSAAARQKTTGQDTARPRTARPTASRPQPRLQHPAKTPRTTRPVQGQGQDLDIDFYDYNEKEQQRSVDTTKKKTKAPKSKFRKGLLIAWIAFAAILAAALILLTVFLSNFEKSRPSDMINRIVTSVEKGKLDDLHLKTEDGTSLMDGTILADLESIASYILQQEEEGEISFRAVNAESDENKKVYLIKAGDKKLLKTVIKRSEKKYAFGFTGWQEEETILLSDSFPVTKLKVQIPQSDQLVINGKTIGREFLVSEGDRISLLGRLISEGLIGEQPTMDTYEVPGIYFQKDVKAMDTSGRTYDCILTADTYTGGFDASQAFIDEHYDEVIDMFEPYALYFSGEEGSGALSRIMMDDSPAYNSAISADVSWMQEHSDVEITDKHAENFKQYSDDVFSCDISFLQTIYQGDDPVKTWDTNMTWIFVRDGDNFYIADFVTRTADEG